MSPLRDWRLNERHYGALEGLNKQQSEQLFTRDKIYKWRRSFQHRPPLKQETMTEANKSILQCFSNI